MKHLPALDGLRAFAILTVVLSHVVTSLIPGGFGVTVFFFISGFIITRMLFAQNFGSGSLVAFYVRRFFRLAPALFVFIAVCGVTMHLLDHPIPLRDYLATLFYYANYHTYTAVAGPLSPLGVTWSLAVEEHFYFVFPILFIAAHRNLTAWLVAVVIGVLLWRCVLVYGWNVPTSRTYFATDARLDSIGWGCLLSVLIHRRSPLLDVLGSRTAVVLGTLVMLATFLIRDNGFRETLRYTLQGAALMPIFCALFWKPSSGNIVVSLLGSRPAVFIGNISYSLYLYHFLLLAIVEMLYDGSVAEKVVILAASFAAATASYYLVENPLRRFGSNLARSLDRNSKAPVAMPSAP